MHVIYTQALLKGFSDHHAVENYISQNVRGRLQTDGEKIKVDVGTLRTKVLVQESKIHNLVQHNNTCNLLNVPIYWVGNVHL